MLALLSLGSAARNWTAVWRGLDEVAMSLDSVEVARDRSTVTITTSIFNHSDETLRIHELGTGLRLTGRSVSAEDQRFDRLLLEPGESITVDSVLQVTTSDREVLDERLERSGERWNVSGRVSVSVQGLSEPVWLPFRFDMDIE